MNIWFRQKVTAFAVQCPAIQQLSQLTAMRGLQAAREDENQKRRSALSLRSGLGERRRLNSPNPIKIASPYALQTHQATDKKTNQTKIQSIHKLNRPRIEVDQPNRKKIECEKVNDNDQGYANPSEAKKQSIPSKQEKGLGSSTSITMTSKGLPQRTIPLDSVSNASFGRKVRQQNNENPYKIIIHQQHKSDPRLPSHISKQETVTDEFLKKHRTTSDPAITAEKWNHAAEQVDSNTSVVLQSKDMLDSQGVAELKQMANSRPCIRISQASQREKAPFPLPPLKESINLPKESSHLMKDSLGLIRSSNQAGQREMKESIVLMKESSVIQSFKGGKLRRCVSVEFQRKEERKMKLRDYLYLNQISGIRKKVPLPEQTPKEQIKNNHPYTRVREFSSDQILETKIKQDIEQNVRRVLERLQLLGQMGDFHGDKLLLYNINAILKEKVGKACDEIHTLIQRYQEQLI